MVRKTLILGVCAVGFALWQGGAHAAAPSFNCAKASTPDELVIYADDELASLDRQTTAAWRRLRGTDKDRATRIAREFIATLQACGSNTSCIRKSQELALANFRAAGGSATREDQTSATHVNCTIQARRAALDLAEVVQFGDLRIRRSEAHTIDIKAPGFGVVNQYIDDYYDKSGRKWVKNDLKVAHYTICGQDVSITGALDNNGLMDITVSVF